MRKKTGGVFWSLAIISLFAIASWVGLQTFRLHGQNAELDAIGVQRQAVIGLKEEFIDRVGSGRFGRREYAPVYYLTFSFPDQNGQSHTVREKVPEKEYMAAIVGGDLPIRVLPLDWRIHEIVPGRLQKLVIRGVYISLALGFFGVLLLFVRIRKKFSHDLF